MMASQLSRQRARVVAYLPSLCSMVRHFRAFSSYDEFSPYDSKHHNVLIGTNSGAALHRIWPDSKLGPLNATDKSCPLPGNIGIGKPLNLSKKSQVNNKDANVDTPLFFTTNPPDMFSDISPHQHQIDMLEGFNKATEQIEEEEKGFDITPSAVDCLECVAQRCPDILRKDFADLFPDRPLQESEVTVITLCQKTDNDMTGWSTEVEEEREVLLEHFIAAAQDICSALHELGFWADFIDPSSGRPYLGAFTNTTFFETDERYRNFGFEIEDLGCCKVISHHLWGTHSYVGCLFTDAPTNHPILEALMDQPLEKL